MHMINSSHVLIIDAVYPTFSIQRENNKIEIKNSASIFDLVSACKEIQPHAMQAYSINEDLKNFS